MEKQSWLDENGRDDEETTVEYSGKSNGTVHIRHGSGGCWSQRSRCERRLIYVVVLILLVCLGLFVALIVVSSRGGDSSPQSKECTTRECVLAASQMAESINFDADPCEDFYDFACGRWVERNVIPEDKSEINTFGLLRANVEVILKNILEDEKHFNKDEVLLKAKTFYKSCMDLEAIEEAGDLSLTKFLREFGGWPVLDAAWSAQGFDLTSLMVKLHLYSDNPLANIWIGADRKNSSTNVLAMDQPSFGLPGRKFYLVARNDSNLAAYETLFTSVVSALGGDKATVEQDAKDVVDFEIQLANISIADESRRDGEKLYNRFTLTQLAGNFSGPIDWQRLFVSLFSHSEVNIPLGDNEVVIVNSPLFFTRLNGLLDVTPNRTVANYLVWRITMKRLGQMSLKYRDLLQEYHKVLSGTAIPQARFRTCANTVTNFMGLPVGHMFVKRAFDEDAKHLAQSMITELKNAFNEILGELDWMDEATKIVAKEKNEYISEKIGYPEDVLNITYLTELYENYTYFPNTFFDNMLTNLRQASLFSLRKLREPIDLTKWSHPPSTVNAFYNPQKNQILFPAGILQPPFYKNTRPMSLNFGAIGVVIGHEITHGFDDRGRQHDKFGNLKQWWTDAGVARFKARAQCIIEQYGNFTVAEAGMKLNGVNTQGENIADNGGVVQSFRAYKNWVKTHGEEPILPGLHFDNKQLFFVNFAQIWCMNMRHQAAVNRVRTGFHSPGRFRVIGTLQNSEDFAQAFSCKKGKTYMNPVHKCRVW